MINQTVSWQEREFHELTGALTALNDLQERLELRLNEARDDWVCEVLDNVIALVGANRIEYQQRKAELQTNLGLDPMA